MNTIISVNMCLSVLAICWFYRMVGTGLLYKMTLITKPVKFRTYRFWKITFQLLSKWYKAYLKISEIYVSSDFLQNYALHHTPRITRKMTATNKIPCFQMENLWHILFIQVHDLSIQVFTGNTRIFNRWNSFDLMWVSVIIDVIWFYSIWSTSKKPDRRSGEKFQVPSDIYAKSFHNISLIATLQFFLILDFGTFFN